MNELSHWKNQQMQSFRKEMDRLFRSWWSLLVTDKLHEGMPFVDIVEGPFDVVVKAEVPGFKAEDLEVTVRGRELSIKGRRSLGASEGMEGVLFERGLRSFSRTIRLPCIIDEDLVEAYYDSGVLTLKMPRKTSSGRRYIEIATR